MIFFRKRLFFWLVRAYLKKWGKRIIFFFIIGLVLFFFFIKYVSSFISKIPTSNRQTIGIAGDYKIDTLPRPILENISMGLTSVREDGTILPGLASAWKILENGKKYEFFLKNDQYFSDGTKVNSSYIAYNFSDVVIERPSQYHVVFKLKDNHSPFLVSVSRPIFKKGFVGVGHYAVKKIELNGDFVKSLTLANTQNSQQIKSYEFYGSQEALKLAFLLGEIDVATGVSDFSYKSMSLKDFPNVVVSKNTNYNHLVTLFYNTKDTILSDEKIRNSLTYALPDTFSSGKRNTIPFSPKLWVNSESNIVERKQDIEKAKELLESSSASKSAQLTVTIKSFPKYKKTAEEIAKEWKKIDVLVKIEEIASVPSDFQIFLGDFQLSKDPDQYLLWHSAQPQNITGYENLRIDKLLEDGRKTTDIAKRKKIYEDFQKYLLADSPAAFLFFPYEYDLIRK